MSEAVGEPRSNRPGKHRRSAGAGTWTPVARPREGSGRHYAPEPAAAAPLQAGVIDPDGQRGYHAYRRPPVAAFAGELTLDDAGVPDFFEPPEPRAEPDAQWPAASTVSTAPVTPVASTATSIEDLPVKRTKVTLTPPAKQDDSARVYIAPPPDGLGKFDLGNVPASVTPPRSWRKAAWFATVSSGGVVVALLLAGSYLVGQPTQQEAIDGWTGFRGEQPEIHDDDLVRTSPRPVPRTSATASATPQRISDVAGIHPSRKRSSETGSNPPGTTSGPGGSGSTSVTVTESGSATTSQEPQKPRPTPADRETNSAAVYRFPPDAQTMGDRSEIFLNEITENPERAHEQTGGDLYAEGAEGIARRYEHIAYFEIEHIYIDQENRMTINSVRVVFKDGTSESQQRTLRFEEGDKITQD